MTTINIRDLKIKTIIGTCSHERIQKQTVIINLSFQYKACKAIANDSIHDAMNYEDLVLEIKKGVRKTKFFLLEKLADFVLKIVMKHPQILSATVEIEKPRAMRDVRSVSVKMDIKK